MAISKRGVLACPLHGKWQPGVIEVKDISAMVYQFGMQHTLVYQIAGLKCNSLVEETEFIPVKSIRTKGKTTIMHKMLLDLPTQFETKRLILRGYRPDDSPWYYEMCQKNQDHLSRYEASNPVMTIRSEEEAEILMREFSAAWTTRSSFIFGAFTKTNHVFVAQIYIRSTNWDLPEFEIGYFVDQEQEGWGYVTESVQTALSFIFQHLKAHRVFLQCDDTNVRSYKVAERCGFIREGHLRENKNHPGGGFTGTYCYGLLKDEFVASN